jgi:hypothetical protein
MSRRQSACCLHMNTWITILDLLPLPPPSLPIPPYPYPPPCFSTIHGLLKHLINSLAFVMCAAPITLLSMSSETRAVGEVRPNCPLIYRSLLLTCHFTGGYPRPIINFRKNSEIIADRDYEGRVFTVNFYQVTACILLQMFFRELCITSKYPPHSGNCA